MLSKVSESAKEDSLFSGTLSPALIESDHPGTIGKKKLHAFYSNLFTVPKLNSDFLTILHLQEPYVFHRVQKF